MKPVQILGALLLVLSVAHAKADGARQDDQRGGYGQQHGGDDNQWNDHQGYNHQGDYADHGGSYANHDGDDNQWNDHQGYDQQHGGDDNQWNDHGGDDNQWNDQGGGYPHHNGGFHPAPAPSPFPQPRPFPQQNSVQLTCLSGPQLTNYCAIGRPIFHVRLLRTYTARQCIDGYTFGISPDRRSLWVSDGCRATFMIN